MRFSFASCLLIVLVLILSASAKTHDDYFNVPCPTLWAAVKDVILHSGKYGVVGLDNEDMAGSYNIGGTLAGKRVNSVNLKPKGDGCVLSVQTAYSGAIHNDAGDFKKRVEESLAKTAATDTSK
jgi:hypothetical protein